MGMIEIEGWANKPLARKAAVLGGLLGFVGPFLEWVKNTGISGTDIDRGFMATGWTCVFVSLFALFLAVTGWRLYADRGNGERVDLRYPLIGFFGLILLGASMKVFGNLGEGDIDTGVGVGLVLFGGFLLMLAGGMGMFRSAPGAAGDAGGGE